MSDAGHKGTDDIIAKMEKRIAKEYKQASKEVDKKLKEYMKSFAAKEKAEREKLANGEITEDQFNRWRMTQMLTGKRWEALRDSLTQDMVNANGIARSTIQEHMADVYALNRNYAAYEIEQDAHIDTSWTLYNRRAVENLFRDNERMLPMPKEGGKAWQAMMNKDTRWNQQKIHSSMIQGILQGDGAREMSERLQKVVGMNYTSAVRNARTMSTYIQSEARQDTYDDLEAKGIELTTVWIATLDDRTRESHRWLHGTERDPETGLFMNGLEFPADPAGDPEEVYNCRCTIRSTVKGFDRDVPKWSPKMGDETYEEWLGNHNPFEDGENVVEQRQLYRGKTNVY